MSDGEIRVLGRDPSREPLAVKRRVGYLPDSVDFYDGITARENLAYTARLMGIPRPSAYRPDRGMRSAPVRSLRRRRQARRGHSPAACASGWDFRKS